ncbi:MAG: hypothetical protein MJ244_02790 [Clostridia bacterium]|nr:hypothetical protein [Clostridia bacterium]
MNTSNYKIEKMTYEEYLNFKDLFIRPYDETEFNIKQNENSFRTRKYFKIRVNFDIVYFEATIERIYFINKNIYEYDDETIINIFKKITNLGINKGVCFYINTFDFEKGVFSDYVDNEDSKKRFANNNEKSFYITNIKKIQKINITNENNISYDDTITVEEKMINGAKEFVLKSKNGKYANRYKVLDDNSLFLIEILYERIIEDAPKRNVDVNDFFNFVEKGISMMQKDYKNIYTYTDLNFENKYLPNMDFIEKDYLKMYSI